MTKEEMTKEEMIKLYSSARYIQDFVKASAIALGVVGVAAVIVFGFLLF